MRRYLVALIVVLLGLMSSGAYGIGPGVGIRPGGRGPAAERIKASFVFAALSIGANASPATVTVKRASTAGAENGTGAYLVAVAAVDQARIAQWGVDATTRGLRVEGGYTNVLSTMGGSRSPQGWVGAPDTGGSVAANALAGPDGLVLAAHVASPVGGRSSYTFNGFAGLAGQLASASCWLRAGARAQTRSSHSTTVLRRSPQAALDSAF